MMYSSDEDLDEWIRQQASASDLGVEPPQQRRDPYAEYMQLRGSMPAQSAGPPPQLPEQDYSGFLGAAGGAVLDAILNKGRGVGKIAASAAMNYGNDINERRRAEFELARQQNLRKSSDPLDQYMEYARIVNGQEANARQLDALGLRKDLVDPNSAAAQGKVTQVGKEAGAKTEGRIGAEFDNKDKIGEVSASRSEGTATGREAADAKFADAKRARDVQRAAEIAKALGPIKNEQRVDLEEELAPIRTGAAVDKAQQLAPIQRQASADRASDMTAELGKRDAEKKENAASAPLTAAQRQSQLNDFNEKNKDMIQVAVALNALDQELGDHFTPEGKLAGDIPGFGPMDDFGLNPEDDPRVRALKQFVSGKTPQEIELMTKRLAARTDVQHAITGAASANAEEKRLGTVAGAFGSSQEEALASLETLRERVRSRLAASSSGREDLASEVLKNAGVLDWSQLGKHASKSSPASPAQITPAQDRGISQPAPLEPPDPGNAVASEWIVMPDGTKLSVRGESQEDIQEALRMGAHLE